MMTPTFWRGKKVLITGHTGFKGSWLSLWLQMLGAEILGFSLQPPTQPNLFELANISQGMQSVIGDIRDLDQLSRTVSEFRPEIVIHMAAQPIVRRSYAAPIETFSTNIMGTANLLEAVRSIDSVRAVLSITSDKCYENREWVWGYREQDRLGGYDPYSSSKACAELVAASYRNSFFNPSQYSEHGVALATARAGNVIGGGDWADDRLVPDLLKALLKGQSADIRNPYATRPWQHVLEPLSGYLLLAEKLYTDGIVFAEGWNFGPDQSNVQTVGWIADRLYSLWGEGLHWKKDAVQSHVHENTYLMLDCSKAHAKLDWHPKLDLESTLNWIVEWTKAFSAESDMHSFTEAQIDRFMKTT